MGSKESGAAAGWKAEGKADDWQSDGRKSEGKADDRASGGTERCRAGKWHFAAFGTGADTEANTCEGGVDTGKVRICSRSGKIVPLSTDGLAFYYTALDAERDNFVLRGTARVERWTLSNGQEGLGLMAADAVGVHGDERTFWNNSYMVGATKVIYYWDKENGQVSDVGDRIVMKQGVCAQEKTGATGPDTDASGFRSVMVPLEWSCGPQGEGIYNILGNYDNEQIPTGDQPEPLTEFKFALQRDNTGYRLSYTDAAGHVCSKLFYDTDRRRLSVIDPEHIYVGFYAARNVDVSFYGISLEISDAADDAPAQEPVPEPVTPVFRIISAVTANRTEYELRYRGNADGQVIIRRRGGSAVADWRAAAGQELAAQTALEAGDNTFDITVLPEPGYLPRENAVLKDYGTKRFSFTVHYKKYERENLHVSPSGSSEGDGSRKKPLDIYTAVKYAAPGQKILLAPGIYRMEETLTVERGISGTAEKRIYMMAEPSGLTEGEGLTQAVDLEKETVPVFDFLGKGGGMVLAGDYWYFQGFDVIHTADTKCGIQLSGSHCVLDLVEAYHNGNTGIQISRYRPEDGREWWPCHNLVLNCSSYGNEDKGYEDADGFAAKLTVGEGNVFDGCISHHNADDGWDLFAKVETGPVGSVLIRNCVAYSNGFMEDGRIAGNGNGFKLGGSSITGRHQLVNCISFDNKAKGIDSNSCPDGQVSCCTSFNNGEHNVAFYTVDAGDTDYLAEGILSWKTVDPKAGDLLQGRGSQDESRIFGKNNYYWYGTEAVSQNCSWDRAENAWFVSLEHPRITRGRDGVIHMNGFLEPTESTPAGVGARLSGTPSPIIPIGID